MDRYPAPGYPLYPSPRPSSSRWPEPEYAQAPPPRQMRQAIMQYHPYPVPKLQRRKCHCDDQLNVIQEKVTTIQTIVTNIATKLNASLEESRPEAQSPAASPNVAASASPSPAAEREPERLQYSDVVIPSTSKERRDLIKKMEEELEQRKEQNKEHEQRIAGLREELEQLRNRRHQ